MCNIFLFDVLNVQTVRTADHSYNSCQNVNRSNTNQLQLVIVKSFHLDFSIFLALNTFSHMYCFYSRKKIESKERTNNTYFFAEFEIFILRFQ